MMANISIHDVEDLYFQHKTLMRVFGQQHFGSLWVPSEELKANSSSVVCMFTLAPTNLATICNIVRGRVHHPNQPWSLLTLKKALKPKSEQHMRCGRRLITCSICAKLLKEHLSPKW